MRLISYLLFLSIGLASHGFAAVAVDVAVTAVASSGTTHDSSAFSIANNSDILLLARVAENTNSTTNITACAWDPEGVNEAMTKHDVQAAAAGPFSVYLWYKKSPTVAASKIVRCTGSSSFNAAVDVLVLYNVDQTTTFRTPVKQEVTGTNTSTLTISTSANSDYAVDIICVSRGGTPAIASLAPTSGTERTDLSTVACGSNDSQRMATSDGAVTGANHQMQWTWTNNGGGVHLATAVIEASSARRRTGAIFFR